MGARPEQLVQYIVPLLVKATKVVGSVGSVGSVGFWVYQTSIGSKQTQKCSEDVLLALRVFYSSF